MIPRVPASIGALMMLAGGAIIYRVLQSFGVKADPSRAAEVGTVSGATGGGIIGGLRDAVTPTNPLPHSSGGRAGSLPL